jgi:GDPmannose 4,6-dehydratase
LSFVSSVRLAWMTNTPRRALLTGITGQDGSYLAEFLLAKGYEVHGIIRRSSSFNTGRLDHLYQDPHVPRRNLVLHYGDLNDASSLNRVLRVATPHEIYNLGAQSHVKVSFDVPEYTAEVTAVGATRILEAIRELGLRPRFYQASSSEMFGKVAEMPQTETTPFHPRSPYGVAKAYAHGITVNYRESYGLHASSGILFNHESPRRGETFVTRKITRAAGRIVHGLQDVLFLGNLDAKRDWGFAGDFIEAMWLMLQKDEPGDYVVATGEMHTVREFCDRAFARAGRPLRWTGSGPDETGVETKTGAARVRVDARYFRPAEVDLLLGDASKARRELGWAPKVTFESLVNMMLDADLDKARQESAAARPA